MVMTLVLIVAGVPVMVAGAALGSAFVLPAIAGTSVGLMGVLILHTIRNGLIVVGVMAASATMAVLVSPWPLASAALLGLSGVAFGISCLRGWNKLVMLVAIWNAYLVVTPTQIGSAGMLQGDAVEFSLRASWATGLIVLGAGVFTACITPTLFRHRRVLDVDPVLDRTAATWMAAGVGLLLFVETLVALSAYRVPAAHWLLLTTLVLVQPTSSKTLQRGVHRAIGTVAGAIVAALIVIAGVSLEARSVIGFALLIAALTIMMTPRPYWLYATLLTPAVILLSAGDANTFDVTVARLGFTLLGIALAFGLMALVWAIQHEKRTFRSRSA